MPYGILERPSLALGTLQASLQNAGIECRTLYAHLDFAREVGVGPYRLVEQSDSLDLIGEWTFSQAAFGDFPHDLEAYQSGLNYAPFEATGMERATLWKILQALRDRAEAFVTKVARQVVESGARLVGASSTFQQHCASLALLRKVKSLDPSLVTVMGGANCEGPMGLALKRNFPWVDYVVSGEADLMIVDLVRAIQHGGPLPEGAIGPDLPTTAPRVTVKNLDDLPTPDYAPYFEALQTSGMHRVVRPGLPIETSRGCWWGARHHCTFCGLNGSGMGFRVKNSDRAVEEFDELAERYGVKDFLVVDNILAMEAFQNLLPRLTGKGYRMFVETKANLKRAHVETLAAAGATWFLPGLEGLHDALLKLMDKGTTGLINLQTLKWGRELGLRVNWAILCAFPGERDEWYEEMTAWLPSLEHLQPPAWVARIGYHRFSPYQTRPDDFGVKLEPAPSCRMVYPLPDRELMDLTYFFVDAPDSSRSPEEGPGLRRVREQVSRWSLLFMRSPTLMMQDSDDELEILDTRSVAVRPWHSLKGEARRVYLACDTAQTAASLQRQLSVDAEPLLRQWEADRLVLRQGDRYLALATRSAPPLPRPADFPGGSAARR